MRKGEYIPKSKRDRLVEAAHNLVAKAIRCGALPPAATSLCVDCGDPAEFYDHRDYNQPLVVAAVCKACNNVRGPGLPLPTEADGQYRKRPNLDTIAHSGHRWDGIQTSRRGKDRKSSSAAIESGASGPSPTGATRQNGDDGYFGYDQAAYRALRNRLFDPWRERSDYFKRHDPWALGNEDVI